jgi:hypothetical protein
MSEAAPDVLDKVDWLRVVDNYGNSLGVDPDIVRSDEEAQQRISQRAQAQQGMIEAQQAKELASAAAIAGEKPVAPDSALERITRGLTGA